MIHPFILVPYQACCGAGRTLMCVSVRVNVYFPFVVVGLLKVLLRKAINSSVSGLGEGLAVFESTFGLSMPTCTVP